VVGSASERWFQVGWVANPHPRAIALSWPLRALRGRRAGGGRPHYLRTGAHTARVTTRSVLVATANCECVPAHAFLLGCTRCQVGRAPPPRYPYTRPTIYGLGFRIDAHALLPRPSCSFLLLAGGLSSARHVRAVLAILEMHTELVFLEDAQLLELGMDALEGV
jgi:hypothetical protein